MPRILKPRLVLAGIVLASAFAAGCARSRPPDPLADIALTMPMGAGLLPVGRGTLHIVQPGESLWSISRQYGVDLASLRAANRLPAAAAIETGQHLLIPGLYPGVVEGGPLPIPLYRVRSWDYIVIHHSATPDGTARSIDTLHHKRGFWNGLGYHFVIDNGTDGKEDGEVEVGHRWVRQMDGAHCNADGMNQRGIGICLIGNFSNGQRVSQSQFESLIALVETLRRYYNVPLDHIIRHSDVPGKNTECPGKNFPWEALKQRLLFS